jgi:hypothetical protein
VSVHATKEMSDWLEKLGMSEYAERFAEDRIDFSVLPDLSDQDLKDLGTNWAARQLKQNNLQHHR